MRASITLASAAVLALTGVVAAPVVASSAADATGTVLSVTVDPGPFTVDGFSGQAQSRITAVVDDPQGFPAVGQTMDWDYTGVEAVLVRTSGGPPASATVDLPQVSMSGTTGTFSGVWRIAATRGGNWTLTDLIWPPQIGVDHDPRVSPGVTRTVTVVATNAPTVSMTLVPGTVPHFDPTPGVKSTIVQRAHITFRTASGAPIVGAKVLWGTEYSCMDPMPPTPGGPRWGEATLTTDAAGQVSGKLVIDFSPGQTCVSLLGPPLVAGDLSTSALVLRVLPFPHMYYSWVSAAPLSRAVRLGHTLTMTGSTSPTPSAGLLQPNRGVVRLQRLVGRTWRTVASASIHRSGRYVAAAIVTNLGRAYYRIVALHSQPVLAPTPSRVVIVTGTLR